MGHMMNNQQMNLIVKRYYEIKDINCLQLYRR